MTGTQAERRRANQGRSQSLSWITKTIASHGYPSVVMPWADLPVLHPDETWIELAEDQVMVIAALYGPFLSRCG